MAYERYEQWKTTPLAGEPHLSIIIPAYNESERIVPTIGAIASHVSNLGYDWELIIADDGSRDGTPDLVEQLGLANLRLLRAERNGGKGSAVRRGVLAAKGSRILFSDADNSTPIEEIGQLMQALDDGFDLAVGSRASNSADAEKRTFVRRLVSAGLRWIVRNMLNIGVRDTQCGFKLFTRAAAQHLATAQTITGFSFDLELLYLAAKFGYRTKEVPVNWIDAPGSKVNVSKEVQRFLKDLVKIKMNDIRGVYARA
jgi:dolichyl-phosphate beta-glucosyltransferase